MNNSRQVFISYGRNDIGTPIAIKLRDYILSIKEVELTAFLDTSNLRDGEQWQVALEREIDDSFLIIVLCSEKANNSEFVKFEWQYAMGAKKKIIAIKIQESETPIPSQLMRFHSSNLDFLNLTEGTWQSLMNTITNVFNETHIPTSIQRAMEFAEHPLEDYRKQALTSLYENQHPSSVDALAELATNSFLQQIRWEAAQYLANKSFRLGNDAEENDAILKGHKKKINNAVAELASHLFHNNDSYNVINGSQASTFETALNCLVKIGTDEAYTALADFYLNLFDMKEFRDMKRTIVYNFINSIITPKVEENIVRIIKHREDVSAPQNKWELLKRLAQLGNIAILKDIEQCLLGQRSDMSPGILDNQPIQAPIINYMYKYEDKDVIPIYQKVIRKYVSNGSNSNGHVYRTALQKMEEIGGQQVIDVFSALLPDTDREHDKFFEIIEKLKNQL